jgi:hypothetical protein
MLPGPQCSKTVYLRNNHTRIADLPVDTGVRDVDVVTHSQFTSSSRRKQIKISQQEDRCKLGELDPLKKGDFVLLQVAVSNCPTYPFQFVIAQVVGDISQIDTTHADSLIEFQVFRPSTLDKLESKLLPWVGDTNKLWKESFARGFVKAIVEVQVKGKKLTAKMIKDKFF